MAAEQQKIIDWQSPYQTQAYFEACNKIGIPCTAFQLGGQTYFFYQRGDKFVAWELPAKTTVAGQALPPTHQAYVLEDVGDYDAINWDDRPVYTTLFTHRDDWQRDETGWPVAYQPRFKRSLKKSFEGKLNHGLAETDNQVLEALALFVDFPDRRDNLDLEFFQFAVWQWLTASVADMHVVYSSHEDRQILAAAMALTSASQANLRYYTARRDSSNPGHFLHHSMLTHYLQTQNFQLVDQSGVTSPRETDPGLRGINQFKLQTTHRVAKFVLK